jgi:VanZ family protein
MKTFIFWTLIILALCTVPGKDLPNTGLFQQDKWGHLGVFLIWAFLLYRIHPNWKSVLFWGIVYGFGLEVYQSLLPFGRMMDFWDGVADTIGTVLGIFVGIMYQKQIQKRSS